MKSIEITARSVEEAVEKALEELELKRDEVEVEVLEEASRGFLGIIGAKMAKVRVTEKLSGLKKAQEFLENVTRKMGVMADITVEEKNDYAYLTLNGDNLGILIGRRGDTLDALQYLTNLVANKGANGERVKIILDAERYRQKRENTLKRLATRIATKVKKTGNKVVLEPMSPQERRIIHTALQNDKQVQTTSEGKEPYRRVVIFPSKNRNK